MELKNLYSQRGAALLMGVMAVSFGLVTTAGVLSNYLMTLTAELSRQKLVVIGQEALRDFSSMARKANEVYEATAGACNASTYVMAGGRRFCWPTTANAANCIRHPASNKDVTTARKLCTNIGGSLNQDLEIVMNRPAPTWREWSQDKLIASLRATAAGLNYFASAQTGESYTSRPATTGAPTNFINYTATCPAGAQCKRCVDIGANARNLNCVKLRVCLRETGTCAADEFIEQTVGITRTN